MLFLHTVFFRKYCQKAQMTKNILPSFAAEWNLDSTEIQK